jgi:hypothetical protein
VAQASHASHIFVPSATFRVGASRSFPLQTRSRLDKYIVYLLELDFQIQDLAHSVIKKIKKIQGRPVSEQSEGMTR